MDLVSFLLPTNVICCRPFCSSARATKYTNDIEGPLDRIDQLFFFCFQFVYIQFFPPISFFQFSFDTVPTNFSLQFFSFCLIHPEFSFVFFFFVVSLQFVFHQSGYSVNLSISGNVAIRIEPLPHNFVFCSNSNVYIVERFRSINLCLVILYPFRINLFRVRLYNESKSTRRSPQ